MEDIMKVVQSLKDSGLLLNDSVKQFKMKQKNKKEDFLVCYQVHQVLVHQDICQQVKESQEQVTKDLKIGFKDLQSKAGKGIIRAGYISKFDF